MGDMDEDRMREMEEEMSRFEEEISARQNEAKLIIGANTYNRVQQQLAGIAEPEEASYEEDDEYVYKPPNVPLNVTGIAIAPPPPPPRDPAPSTPQYPQSQNFPYLPPPPPPPLRPAFIPHQLRRPPPMPRPLFHPQGGPGRLPPPPPPPMMGGNYGPPGRPEFFQPRQTPPVVIEKPKTVYSAAPVRITPVKSEKSIDKVAVPSSSGAKDSKNSEPSTKKPKTAKSTEAVAPGIELNVPVKMLEMQHYGNFMESDVPEHAMTKKEKRERKRKFVRTAAGQVWEDPSLAEWDPDDFRIFCGDLGNEVTDDTLARAFSKYPSFVKARIVRDKKSNKTRGYGFVSFKDPNDFVKAMREMNGKYVGNRPIKLRKSTWKDRQIDIVKKKEKEKKRLGLK